MKRASGPPLSIGFVLALCAAGISAQDPSLVLGDGGLQFPDGTVQTNAATGPPAPVEDTGQQRCFDASGATADEIACAATGQDGYAAVA